jgi:hypothetical protein
MDVCRECQLLYGCVYSMSVVVWMCVQCVSCCMDVCTVCQLLYRCVYSMSTIVWIVCTGCQLKSHWEVLQQVSCIPPRMLSLPDIQMRKPRLKHSKRNENHRLPTVKFASNILPHFPRISSLVQIRQIKYCDNNKNEIAGKTTFL